MLGRGRGGRRDYGITEQRIGRLQVDHLASTGHRQLAYPFPQDERLHSLGRLRLDGVRQA